MQQIILQSLIRQAKGSEQLGLLLVEEYSLLRQGRPDDVAGLEIIVQELIRQLVREREFMVRRLELAGMDTLANFMSSLPSQDAREYETWRAMIITHEQDSARQASINADLAMALWRQSGDLLQHLQQRVAPRERNTYTAKGTWHNRPATAALVSGRL
jgi:hypothetical protein